MNFRPLVLFAGLSVLGAACTSTEPQRVPAVDQEVGIQRRAPMSPEAARRLFLTEERLRRGIRPNFELRSEEEPSPVPVAPVPERITHADVYRLGRRDESDGPELGAAESPEPAPEASQPARVFLGPRVELEPGQRDPAVSARPGLFFDYARKPGDRRGPGTN